MNDKTKFIIEATAVTIAAIWAATELAHGLALGLYAVAFGRLLVFAQPGFPASIKASLRLVVIATVILLTSPLINEWFLRIGMFMFWSRDEGVLAWKVFVLFDWWVLLRGIRRRYQLL